MDAIEPILVDRQTAKRVLGNIGDTKLYELLNSGAIEGRYLDNKRVFTYASLKALAGGLPNTPPHNLEKRNRNMKYCGEDK
jgi:hypothetical protein